MFKTRSHNRQFLEGWNKRMCSEVGEPLVDKVVVALLKQSGQGEIPYEPRNLYHPDALYEMLATYDPAESPWVQMDDQRVRKGIDFSYKHFAKPQGVEKLDAIHLQNELGSLFSKLDIKKKTSAGLTAYGKTKLEAWPVGVRKAKETLTKERKFEPCLAGTRTQQNKKGRLVWMYPLSMTILEALVARPLIDKDLTTENPMAFGVKSTKLGSSIRKAQAYNNYYVSLDSSQFDASVGKTLIQAAFNAFRTWFNLDQEIYEDVTVGDLFDLLEGYFIYTPIVMPSPDGPVYYSGKRHGVPSGSYFTQMVDSFVTAALVGTIDYTYNLRIKSDEFWVLGDDMLFFTTKEPKISKWANLLSRLYGITLNSDKSEVGEARDILHFLGREWDNGIPHRGWENVMERAVSPERYRNYGDDVIRGAQLVLASYGLTSLYRHLPHRIDPFQGLEGARFVPDHMSGLHEYLVKEGVLTNLVTRSLH